MKDSKFEIYIYLLLLLLSLIWSAFQPILILIIFFILRFLRVKIKKKNIIHFVIILFLSIVPFIKNKIIFNIFSVSSWAGHQLSTTLLNWQELCHLRDWKNIYSKESVSDLKMYEKNYNRKFEHPSLIGNRSGGNYVGIIYKSQNCLKMTINKIIENPKEYLLGRTNAFLASHGKFAFDFLYPKPVGWDKYYFKLNELYLKPKIKLSRQIIIFIYMIVVYLYFLNIIFLSKEKSELKNSYFVILSIYFYILITGHLATGHEQARMLYSGIIIHMLFFIHIIKKLFNEKKN